MHTRANRVAYTLLEILLRARISVQKMLSICDYVVGKSFRPICVKSLGESQKARSNEESHFAGQTLETWFPKVKFVNRTFFTMEPLTG